MSKLFKQDLLKLQSSCLTDATIEAIGFWTCSDEEGRALLGWTAEMKGDAQGLVIPFPGTTYAKVRPHNPRAVDPMDDRKAEKRNEHAYWGDKFDHVKRRKYENPIGRLAPFWKAPEGLCPRSKMEDVSVPLVFTEWELKASLLAQEGVAVICARRPIVNTRIAAT